MYPPRICCSCLCQRGRSRGSLPFVALAVQVWPHQIYHRAWAFQLSFDNKTDILIRSGGEIDDSFKYPYFFCIGYIGHLCFPKRILPWLHDGNSFLFPLVLSFKRFFPWKTLVGPEMFSLHSGGISSLPKCSRELRVVFAIDGRSDAQVIGWTWCQGGRGSWKFAGHQKRDSGTHTATWVVVEVDVEMVGVFMKVWVEFGGS